mgnify:CR=1 FL=1
MAYVHASPIALFADATATPSPIDWKKVERACLAALYMYENNKKTLWKIANRVGGHQLDTDRALRVLQFLRLCVAHFKTGRLDRDDEEPRLLQHIRYGALILLWAVCWVDESDNHIEHLRTAAVRVYGERFVDRLEPIEEIVRSLSHICLWTAIVLCRGAQGTIVGHEGPGWRISLG